MEMTLRRAKANVIDRSSAVPTTEDNGVHGCQTLATTVRRKIDKMSDINFLRVSEAQLPKTVSSSYYAAQRGVVPPRNRFLLASFCAWGGEINAPAGQMVGGATSNRGALGARERLADGIGRGRCGVASASGSRR